MKELRSSGIAPREATMGLIAAEMAAYRSAATSGEVERAWHHLERVHIVSQPYLGPHLASHCAMLSSAIRQRDWDEALGQVIRIILAPLGALTGRLPVGNIGRSSVSAFASMPIPADLAEALSQQDQIS